MLKSQAAGERQDLQKMLDKLLYYNFPSPPPRTTTKEMMPNSLPSFHLSLSLHRPAIDSDSKLRAFSTSSAPGSSPLIHSIR
ncbi:hypothetical protein Droror1_Dr00000786 [Drosera rotundifolia]